MNFDFGKRVRDWQLTGSQAAGVALAVVETAVAGQRHVVTHISYASDAAATVTVQSPNGIVVWRRVYAAAFSDETNFYSGLRGATGEELRVQISTAPNSSGNAVGYSTLG